MLSNSDGITIETIPTMHAIYNSRNEKIVKQPAGADPAPRHQQRLERLKEVYTQMEPKPDVFISEFWPLGFRYFEEDELLPFMKFMKEQNPDIQNYAFLRDYNILDQSPENSSQGRIDVLNKWFDLALFRGDETLIPLEKTFHGKERNITIPHRHVGQMMNPDQIKAAKALPMVVVSAGGGNLSHTDTFFRQCLRARQHSRRLSHIPWRFYIGKGTPPELMEELKSIAQSEPDNENIEIRYADDTFLSALKSCTMALTRGGNTAMEAAIFKKPTLIFPEDKPKSEQLVRAQALANRFPYIRIVGVDDLQDPQHVAQLIDKTYTPHAARSTQSIKVNGAENAARNIIEHFNGLPMTKETSRTLA